MASARGAGLHVALVVGLTAWWPEPLNSLPLKLSTERASEQPGGCRQGWLHHSFWKVPPGKEPDVSSIAVNDFLLCKIKHTEEHRS